MSDAFRTAVIATTWVGMIMTVTIVVGLPVLIFAATIESWMGGQWGLFGLGVYLLSSMLVMLIVDVVANFSPCFRRWLGPTPDTEKG